jgi:fibronectin type 3 domain-containing protein
VSGATFPVTLASGQTAALDVQFDPTTAGAATGQLTITNNSSTNSTAVITLSGTGTAGSYAVNLSWEAPTSSADPVAGYNVYRAPSNTTTYALLNSSPETETAYVDSTVVSGQIYDYIAESVDASGVESSPSNIFSVAIP